MGAGTKLELANPQHEQALYSYNAIVSISRVALLFKKFTVIYVAFTVKNT